MKKLTTIFACSALALSIGCSITTSDGETSASATATITATASASAGTDTTTTTTTGETTGGTTTGGTTTGGTTTGGTTTGGTTTGATTGTGGDPNYPPLDDTMMCPDGQAPASFEAGGAVCMPECTGAGNSCPAGATGDAVGVCAVNPTSTGTDCTEDADCTEAGETCQATGGGGMACLGSPTHCVLVCANGETCPDGMVCTTPGACQYPG